MRFTKKYMYGHETPEQRRGRMLSERRARLNKWHFFLAIKPVRLLKEISDGKLMPSDELATLEIVARRARDLDGMWPWIFGPQGWVITQPTGKVK